MCGGDLEVNEKMTVGTCNYCGSTMTIPKLDDEKRANLYDRANYFRRNNEFDKAAGIYETILNEDKNDAEAYWSLVLCKYGIEYIEDPSTHKRVPTCNRTQFISIFADDDYKQAIANADSSAKSLYEEEAKAIDEIQKGILLISSKEVPFDIFICYKESDSNDRRTQDSVLAHDLYFQLKQEGFKVFFSRITLEDKLGTAYEPYIFAALNSSKVMVVVGTKTEYLNSPWVKNEWSRYLAQMKAGAKKTLIPAYKDMNPYDLPVEFSNLQAQDMSKLGFMQDLIRGIKKIIAADEPKEKAKDAAPPQVSNTVAPLLKRAYLCLEAGEFKKADDLLEIVLNSDPENSEAYLGKLMVHLGVRQEDALALTASPLTNYFTFNNAIRFADAAKRERYSSINQKIIDRNNQKTLDTYNSAVDLFNAGEYEKAEQIFTSLGSFRDSCEFLSSSIPAAKYSYAKALIEKNEFAIAEQTLRSLGEYKDCREYIASGIPAAKYAYAKKLDRCHEYEKAKRIFIELGSYKDCQKQIKRKHSGLVNAVFAGIILTFSCWLFISFLGGNGINIYQSINDLYQRIAVLQSADIFSVFQGILSIFSPAIFCIPVAVLTVLIIDKKYLLTKNKITGWIHAMPFLWAIIASALFICFGLNLNNHDESEVYSVGILGIGAIFLFILLPWSYIVLAFTKSILKKIQKLKKSPANSSYSELGIKIRIGVNAAIAIAVAVALAVALQNMVKTGKEYFSADSSNYLLSFNKPYFYDYIASSHRRQQNENIYEPSSAFDGNTKTAWIEGVKGYGVGQWIEAKADNSQRVKGLSITIGFNKTEQTYYANGRPKKIMIIFDDGSNFSVQLDDLYNQSQVIRFSSPVYTKSIKIKILSVYTGTDADTCIGEIGFY